FIAQGAYGCIFRPFVQCANNTKPTNAFFISKIQKNTTDIENEVNIGKIVSEISSSRHFYAAIEQTCKVNINQIADNELNKCDIIKHSIDKQIDKTTKYVSSKIRFVSGKSITHTLLHLFYNPKQMLVKMIKSNIHLLTGIKKLSEFPKRLRVKNSSSIQFFVISEPNL
ncbi:MAG: hypothetical protein EBU01_14800, partial [Crocinitomicaceae bacterium]|nr:hypothetical protein [Crocinitomicaceae bacterium]